MKKQLEEELKDYKTKAALEIQEMKQKSQAEWKKIHELKVNH